MDKAILSPALLSRLYACHSYLILRSSMNLFCFHCHHMSGIIFLIFNSQSWFVHKFYKIFHDFLSLQWHLVLKAKLVIAQRYKKLIFLIWIVFRPPVNHLWTWKRRKLKGKGGGKAKGGRKGKGKGKEKGKGKGKGRVTFSQVLTDTYWLLHG